jgi:hypothetical protein
LWRACDAGWANWYKVFGRDDFFAVDERLARGFASAAGTVGAAVEDSPTAIVDATGLMATAEMDPAGVARPPDCFE